MSRPGARSPSLAAALAAALLASATARAALPDEIQVYTDDLTKPGERGLELHVNTTPKGLRTPEYPGAVPTRHGLRVTPEFSWGITKDTDIGVYLPTVMDQHGNLYLPGVKVRARWLPLRGGEAGGVYAGANVELSNLLPKFSQSRSNAELRLILGWKSPEWTLGVNPIFGRARSPGQGAGNPDFSTAWKASRTIAHGLALGGEYYAGTGRLGHPLPADRQDRTFYLTLDIDRAPWVFNIGIGRGLTGATDPWTVKAIFEVQF